MYKLDNSIEKKILYLWSYLAGVQEIPLWLQTLVPVWPSSEEFGFICCLFYKCYIPICSSSSSSFSSSSSWKHFLIFRHLNLHSTFPSHSLHNSLSFSFVHSFFFLLLFFLNLKLPPSFLLLFPPPSPPQSQPSPSPPPQPSPQSPLLPSQLSPLPPLPP